MLATEAKSSPKIANSKYDPIDSEMSEMSGRTAGRMLAYRANLNKIGKVNHECIPACSTAFAFEYLISFRAEHNDADRDITGIKGLLFRNRLNGGETIVSKIQSWRNK